MGQSVVELCQQIAQSGADMYILSDANNIFIDIILTSYNIKQYFPADHIFTNHAKYDSAGRCCVDYFHRDHKCDLCPDNLCKGTVLDSIRNINSQADSKQHNVLFYVGDGGGDFCPTLRMKSSDVCFARHSYPLHKKILSSHPQAVECNVQTWSTPDELKHKFLRELNLPPLESD
mmetsp:Transcript_993/g.1308  ORF Transcript_993/g.1308 Transcript_993/m.1308 type:complete len:175 (-) Transcript_993:80-604(-)